MIKLAPSIVGTLLFAVSPVGAQTPDPSGIWMRGDGNARVQIAPCGSNICATNVWIRDTSGVEEVGDKLIMTLAPTSDDTLTGTAYDVKRKRSYSMTMRVSKLALVTRGCILGGILCKRVNWKPAK